MKTERNNTQENAFPTKIFLLVCVIGITIVIVIEHVNIHHIKSDNMKKCSSRPGYCIHDLKGTEEAIKHVQYVLKKVGYEKKANRSHCDLLWYSKSPFNTSQNPNFQLQPHQIVNHFPGMDFITEEVLFATSVSNFIPKTFILPEGKDLFIKYALANPESLFMIKKPNQSRVLVTLTNIELNNADEQSIIQEYIQKPFLVDGFKVDIGVFVVVTSVDPLRAYWYKGDVLIRFSKDKYASKNRNTFSKGYLYTWDMPSLRSYYKLKNGMKNAFDMYVYSSGKNTTSMWNNVQQAIYEVLLTKEHHIVEAIKSYDSTGNFFQILRFDLTVNENLDVYLLGANTLDSMTSNTGSTHRRDIALFYRQLLYNVFALTGISREMISRHNSLRSNSASAREMVASTKQIVIFGKECLEQCRDNCDELVCQLCKLCMGLKLRSTLLKAHAEYMHRGDFKRLVPPQMLKDNNLNKVIPKDLSDINTLQYLWYQGKCNQDMSWCA